MSMAKIIDSMTDGDFSRYMNRPEPTDGRAYIFYDKKNTPWVTCCFCGKRAFPLTKGAVIKGQVFKCKGSSCKREFLVNIEQSKGE